MPSSIDFAALFEIAPNAYMVLDRELRYVAANATYLAVTSSSMAELAGKNIFDLFPNDPDDPANVPARMLRTSFERVLATGKPDHLALIPYRVPEEIDGKLTTRDRYWSATHTPVLDAGGRVTHILQYTVDVTALHASEATAGVGTGGALRQEAGILSRARAVQDDNTRLAAEREQLGRLFEQAPGFMAFLEGDKHVFSLMNEAYRRLIGGREGRADVIGRPVAEALREVADQGFVTLLDQVFQTGSPFIGEAMSVKLERDGALEERIVDFVFQPVRSGEGKTRGIFIQGHDVTERQRAEKAREEARRAAEAFSAELVEQSRAVTEALETANARIRELEAQLAAR